MRQMTKHMKQEVANSNGKVNCHSLSWEKDDRSIKDENTKPQLFPDRWNVKKKVTESTGEN